MGGRHDRRLQGKVGLRPIRLSRVVRGSGGAPPSVIFIAETGESPSKDRRTAVLHSATPVLLPAHLLQKLIDIA